MLVTTIVASSLVFIDGVVVGIALPIIQTQFHASGADAQWVVEGYTLVLGAMMLLAGALADRYGRKRIFLLGVILFALASAAVGLSPTMPFLLIARVVQGIGGTLLAPASLAILGNHFSGEARGKAVGTWSAFTALAAAVGPLLGGLIVDHLSWRWVFFINVPLAVGVVLAALAHINESRDEEAQDKPLDIGGSVLITASLALIVYAFIAAGIDGWHPLRISGAMVLGIFALLAFLFWEGRARNPILPLELFKRRIFSGINALTLLVYAALSGMFYFYPFILIRVDHYPATFTGLSMLPFIVILMLLSRAAGAMVYRLGARVMLTIGPLLNVCGFLAYAFLPGTNYWTSIFPGIVLIGLGMGFTVAPLTTVMMESVEEHRIGLASGVNNAVSRIAGLLAIAILGALLAAVFNAQLTTRLAAAHLAPREVAAANAQRDRLAGAQLTDPKTQQLFFSAYDDGFRAVALACAALCILGAGVTLTVLPKRATLTPGR